MPMATIERMRSQQENLNARMQTALEEWRSALLDKGAAIIEILKRTEQGLNEVLREGMEREALLETTVSVRRQAESIAGRFRGVLAIFEGDSIAMPVIEAQIREVERFLSWVRDLEAFVAAVKPPFDESRLPPDLAGPVAEGYVRISEARARIPAAKKP
jgi:hypothetical protein